MDISGHSGSAKIAAPQHGPDGHPRHANFGSENSAIRRGDLVAAQTALAALTASDAPSAKAALAKGSFEGIGAALAAGDIAAAPQALTAFHARRADVTRDPPLAPMPPAAAGVDLLV